MKRIILILAATAATALFADEIKMKEVEALIDEKKADIVVIDKKEIGKYVKEKKKEPLVTTDIVTVDMHELVSQNQTLNIVESVAEAKKEKVIVDGFESFKSALLLEGSKQIEIEYKLNLSSGLKITKYLFANNMQNRFNPVKEILLKEAKKHSAIDYEAFADALNNMSEAVATEMIAELGGA